MGASQDTTSITPDLLPKSLISVDPEIMHGEPCFSGTRVPVETLFDHLREGDPLSDFLDGFPDVSQQHAAAVIDLAATVLREVLHHRH